MKLEIYWGKKNILNAYHLKQMCLFTIIALNLVLYLYYMNRASLIP